MQFITARLFLYVILPHGSTIGHRILKAFLRLTVDILKIVGMLFTEKVVSVRFVIVFSISKLFRSERLPDCYLIW